MSRSQSRSIRRRRQSAVSPNCGPSTAAHSFIGANRKHSRWAVGTIHPCQLPSVPSPTQRINQTDRPRETNVNVSDRHRTANELQRSATTSKKLCRFLNPSKTTVWPHTEGRACVTADGYGENLPRGQLAETSTASSGRNSDAEMPPSVNYKRSVNQCCRHLCFFIRHATENRFHVLLTRVAEWCRMNECSSR